MIKCPPERRFNLSAVDGQTETISPSHRHAPGRLIDLLLLVFPGTSNLTFFSLFTPVWNNNKHDHGALCRRDTFQDYFMEKKKNSAGVIRSERLVSRINGITCSDRVKCEIGAGELTARKWPCVYINLEHIEWIYDFYLIDEKCDATKHYVTALYFALQLGDSSPPDQMFNIFFPSIFVDSIRRCFEL